MDSSTAIQKGCHGKTSLHTQPNACASKTDPALLHSARQGQSRVAEVVAILTSRDPLSFDRFLEFQQTFCCLITEFHCCRFEWADFKSHVTWINRPRWSFKHECWSFASGCVWCVEIMAYLLVEMTVLDGSVCVCVCVCVCVEVTALGRCSTAVSKIPPKCLPL